jgi:hypothetical protein
VAVKCEAELVTRFQEHLEANGATCVRYKLRPPDELRTLWTDILDKTENELYEAKGITSRDAIRMAIGQLLDYSRHVPSGPSLAILLPQRPREDLLDLLARNRIRCTYETETADSRACRHTPQRHCNTRGLP